MKTFHTTPLDDEELSHVDRYWRAANHLAVGQIHFMANPLPREPPTTTPSLACSATGAPRPAST